MATSTIDTTGTIETNPHYGLLNPGPDVKPSVPKTEVGMIDSGSAISQVNKQKIIDANAKVVTDYKGGKEQALMSLVGQIMKETKGSANPAVAKEVLIDLLK
jgi:aspartyl-tRNA(Asn)/glutamyl-tRNA(Gln) amidotransferase subunit B